MVISQELLCQLLSYTKTNALRLALRLLHEGTLNHETRGAHKARITVSYSHLRQYLPHYVKPHLIRDALSIITPLFSEHTNESNRLRITVKEDYLCSTQHKRIHDANYIEITKQIKTIRDAINQYNEHPDDNASSVTQHGIKFPDTYFDDEMELHYVEYKPFFFNNADRENLANLATEYTLPEVLSAITELYNDFPGGLDDVNSVGAMVRTIIRDNRAYLNFSLSA